MEQSVRRLNLDGAQRIQVQRGQVFDYPMHAHSYFEMTLYQPFDGHLIVNGRRIGPFSPTAVLVTPNDLHRICVRTQGGAAFSKISFDAALLPADLLPDCAVFCRSLEPNDLLHRLFDEILAAHEDRAYAAQLIAAALLALRRRGEMLLHTGRTPGHSLAVRAAALLHEQFARNITLTSAAEALGVSPQYLSKVFSKELGIGFSGYLTELRLHRAAELLHTRAMSVTEVCYTCGYGNLSHFLRSFKRRFGVTPRVYATKGNQERE